jgi:hypothetical protein
MVDSIVLAVDEIALAVNVIAIIGLAAIFFMARRASESCDEKLSRGRKRRV